MTGTLKNFFVTGVKPYGCNTGQFLDVDNMQEYWLTFITVAYLLNVLRFNTYAQKASPVNVFKAEINI